MIEIAGKWDWYLPGKRGGEACTKFNEHTNQSRHARPACRLFLASLRRTLYAVLGCYQMLHVRLFWAQRRTVQVGVSNGLLLLLPALGRLAVHDGADREGRQTRQGTAGDIFKMKKMKYCRGDAGVHSRDAGKPFHVWTGLSYHPVSLR